MKKLLLLLGIFLLLGSVARAEGALIFCESFDDQFKPQNVGASFPGPGISLILTQEKPFGSPSLTLTIYKRDGNRETVLERSNFDINPKWTAYGIRHLAMPGPGEYSIGFTLPDGGAVAQAEVTITGASDEKPAEPQETIGGTLEKAFNKYSTKKQQE